MPIEIRLDVMLALRKARSKDLSYDFSFGCSSRAR